MTTSNLTWIHLTDLHVGAAQHGHDTREILDRLVTDLVSLHGRGVVMKPDLVFMTGDLAYSGGAPDEQEYNDVESLLTYLWKRLEDKLGCTPLLAPVPGNHDLRWQKFTEDEIVLWRSFNSEPPFAEVREQFFNISSDYWLRQKVSNAFGSYLNWLGRTEVPLLPRMLSGHPPADTEQKGSEANAQIGWNPLPVPGQFAATWVGTNGFKVGILGLNSAYYDLPANLKERPKGMALYREQIRSLLDNQSIAQWCEQHNVCLMLTHHPPRWMAPKSLESIRKHLATPRFIALHLCGHLHESQASQYGEGWDPHTLVYLGRSLSGLDNIELGGHPSFGYNIGSISWQVGQPDAKLRIIPRWINPLDDLQFTGEPGVDEITLGRPDKQINIRILNSLPPVPPGISPTALSPSLFTNVKLGEALYRVLTDRSITHSGAYLYGPSGFGKSNLLRWLEHRLNGRVETPRCSVVRIDCSAWSPLMEMREIRSEIRSQIAAALGLEVSERENYLRPGLEQPLMQLRQQGRGLFILVLESFEMLLKNKQE